VPSKLNAPDPGDARFLAALEKYGGMMPRMADDVERLERLAKAGYVTVDRSTEPATFTLSVRGWLLVTGAKVDA
jgi:hypothetical protein